LLAIVHHYLLLRSHRIVKAAKKNGERGEIAKIPKSLQSTRVMSCGAQWRKEGWLVAWGDFMMGMM